LSYTLSNSDAINPIPKTRLNSTRSGAHISLHQLDPEANILFRQQEYDNSVETIWKEMRVNVPLHTSDPHPFISLLSPTKGKKILPRLTRHLPSDRMLVLLTLLVACFDQLDVVRKAPVLDSLVESVERADIERETQAFLTSVMQSILPVVSVAELRLVTGLLGLLLDKTNVVAVAQTRVRRSCLSETSYQSYPL
jgi:DNA topoisomerase 2-associated protein PAT1